MPKPSGPALAALLVEAALLATAACTAGVVPGHAGSDIGALLAGPDSAAAARAAEAVVADSFFAAIARFDYGALERAVTPGFELEEDTLRLSGPQFAVLLKTRWRRRRCTARVA
jgi:hypothetical protein